MGRAHAMALASIERDSCRMSSLNTSLRLWTRPGRPPVDDAYTAWFNAQSRCAQALRAWRSAPRTERAEAYGAYLAALDVEEATARELERQHNNVRAAA